MQRRYEEEMCLRVKSVPTKSKTEARRRAVYRSVPGGAWGMDGELCAELREVRLGSYGRELVPRLSAEVP